MKPQIILRKIASAASYFIKLRHSTGFDRNARADCRTIALGPDQMEEHAVIRILICVEQKRWRFADVENNNVYIAVVSNVAESGAPSGFQRHVGDSCRLRDFFECPIPQISV